MEHGEELRAQGSCFTRKTCKAKSGLIKWNMGCPHAAPFTHTKDNKQIINYFHFFMYFFINMVIFVDQSLLPLSKLLTLHVKFEWTFCLCYAYCQCFSPNQYIVSPRVGKTSSQITLECINHQLIAQTLNWLVALLRIRALFSGRSWFQASLIFISWTYV